MELLREVVGDIRLIGAFDFYIYEDCKDVPFFSRPIIKLSEITEEDNTERVIEVLSNDVWVLRVLVAFKKNKAVCWMDGETIEESKNELTTSAWKKWREIQPKVELTNDVMPCFSAKEIERINKYARHQYNRGQLDLPLVSFEDWVNKA